MGNFQDDVFNNTDWFTFLTEVNDEDSGMTTSNGGTLDIQGIGNVKIPTTGGNLELKDVFHCLNASASMVSPGVLRQNDTVIDGFNDLLVQKSTRTPITEITWKQKVAVILLRQETPFYNFAALPEDVNDGG